MAVAPPRHRVTTEGSALPLAPTREPNPWPRRLGWTIGAIITVTIGLVWLRPGFPEGLVIDVTAWFDAFRDWAIQNRTTSPLFVYFLTPIENVVDLLIDATVTALERLTWFGLVVGAAALAGVLAGWKMAL